MCDICSMLTIKTPDQRQQLRSGTSIVNFEEVNARSVDNAFICSSY